MTLKTMIKNILIGGSKSNVGKTTLARIILKEFPQKFIALKITDNTKYGDVLTEETRKSLVVGKDTYFLSENAQKVFWARGSYEFLKKEIPLLINSFELPLLTEGNIFYDFIKPDIFFFVKRENILSKANALKYENLANYIVINGNHTFKVERNIIFIDLYKNLYSIDTGFKNLLNLIFKEILKL